MRSTITSLFPFLFLPLFFSEAKATRAFRSSSIRIGSGGHGAPFFPFIFLLPFSPLFPLPTPNAERRDGPGRIQLQLERPTAHLAWPCLPLPALPFFLSFSFLLPPLFLFSPFLSSGYKGVKRDTCYAPAPKMKDGQNKASRTPWRPCLGLVASSLSPFLFPLFFFFFSPLHGTKEEGKVAIGVKKIWLGRRVRSSFIRAFPLFAPLSFFLSSPLSSLPPPPFPPFFL